MTNEFRRTGELKDLASYPAWLQRVVRDTRREKMRVLDHELFALMRQARLPRPVMQRFLIGNWPTIERFPRFMAMNLKKIVHGESHGENMARRYLVQNIRVEQKHADHWVEWSNSEGVTLADLQRGEEIEGLSALAHWCWYVCDHEPLPVGIAATNFAIEGLTGEWSCFVCSKNNYFESLPAEIRGPATRWLRVHAEYDDTHPWEALDVIGTILGHNPPQSMIDRVRRAIRASYVYMEMAADHAMMAALHGSFDDTASNSTILGAADFIDAA